MRLTRDNKKLNFIEFSFFVVRLFAGYQSSLARNPAIQI
ncbi:hypothetical protein C942_04188 [Photobacterium marinum]|uniref:Uncharacterized protein n=1 Tax=Photobacterium marinum TaxID=1056511 RepID=L8JCC3_9GAMM|nr:hypothetical protein C942_04188 [Photobacterium marinum]